MLLEKYALQENIALRNRVVMAPMTTWSAQADGQVSLEELDYYRHRSVGVGMVITGTTYVTPNGIGFDGQFYGGDDLYIQSLGRLAQAIHLGGAKAVLQVFHAGRMSKSSLIGGNQVESASAVRALREGAEEPRALDEEEIYNILDAFYNVTVRAIKAGFDGVEIHGANTYLIQQFFSPHSNRRTDYWGGDLESRMRFPIAVLSSVKRAVMDVGQDDFIIGYRLSPEEVETPGIRLVDTLRFVDILSDMGLSYLNVSLGRYNQTSLNDKKDNVPVGKQIIDVVNKRIPVLGVGGIWTKEDAEMALDLGYDLIQLGRSIVLNPDWVMKVSNDNPVRRTINESIASGLYIPQKMQERIFSVPDWFPVDNGGKS